MPSEKSRRRSGSELPVNQSVPKFRGGVYIWTMNSRRVLSCFVLLAFLASGQTPSTKPSPYDSEHARWIAASLKEMQTIKVGMSRGELLKVFTTEGSLSTVRQRRYVYRDCPYIKVEVEFAPVEKDQLVERQEDKIVTISRPFLQFGIYQFGIYD